MPWIQNALSWCASLKNPEHICPLQTHCPDDYHGSSQLPSSYCLWSSLCPPFGTFGDHSELFWSLGPSVKITWHCRLSPNIDDSFTSHFHYCISSGTVLIVAHSNKIGNFERWNSKLLRLLWMGRIHVVKTIHRNMRSMLRGLHHGRLVCLDLKLWQCHEALLNASTIWKTAAKHY